MGSRCFRRFSVVGFCLACLAVSAMPTGRADGLAQGKLEQRPMLREPVALVLGDDGQWLYTANRRSGSVSVLDCRAQRVVAEVPVGRKLSDLVGTPDGRHLLAADEEGGELLVLSRRGPTLDLLHRIKVSPAPVSVQVTADGSRCFVASLWSRRLALINLVPGVKEQTAPPLHVAKVVRLPFSPGKQLLVRGGTKLIVADAFGGRLAIVDGHSGALEAVHRLPAHNIRGLAIGR